jgi:hypothetical protein
MVGESRRAGDVPWFAGVRDESLWLVRSLDLSGNMLLADAGVTGLAFALVRATWKAMLRHAFDAMQHSTTRCNICTTCFTGVGHCS